MRKDSLETAYSFFHQKLRIYLHSQLDWQKDDIEYAICSFTNQMDSDLYALLADGQTDFLRTHTRFQDDLSQAVEKLEAMLGI